MKFLSLLRQSFRSHTLVKGGVALFIVGSIFLPFVRTADAVVPVHCPTICQTWDVALSGKIGASPERWFATKEHSSTGLASVTGIVDAITNPSLDAILWEIARVILRQFAENIIEWIKTGQDPFFFGGTNGGLFVTNIDEFVLDAADNAAGVFLSEYLGDAYDNLCSPFRLDVALGLGHSYGRDYGSFKYQARCSITDIVANLEDFYNDFENGGWEAWFATSRYENNPLGLLTLSVETSIGRETRAANANILDFSAGLGFLGLRECPPENQIPGPTQDGKPLCKNNGYITKSPGKAVEDQLADALGQDIRQLEIADEMNEIIAAIFDELLSWALGGAGGGLLGYEKGSVPDFPDPGDTGALSCARATGKPSGCECSFNEQCASKICNGSLVCEAPPTPPDIPGGGTTQCSDGFDNDGDRLIDSADPDCVDANDDSEAYPLPECSDGLDNDGDLRIDFPVDPECPNALFNDETGGPPPHCSDGLDNDGDSLIDWPDDPGCRDIFDDRETDTPNPTEN